MRKRPRAWVRCDGEESESPEGTVTPAGDRLGRAWPWNPLSKQVSERYFPLWWWFPLVSNGF